MLKKIILGIVLIVLLVVGVAAGWLWSMYESQPTQDSSVVQSPEAPVLPDALSDQLTDYLAEYRAAQPAPSISVAIGINGELVWAGANGWADLEAERPASPQSMYRIGSVSKSITTVALGRMMEEGLIDLDSTFREYVPSFPAKRWDFNLRQLASHTAGVRHYQSPLENYHDEHYERAIDGLALVREDPLLFEPGTRFSYSSYGYNMLSAAMAAAADMPFVDLLSDYVFEPAGMAQTQAEDARSPTPDTVAFYNQTPEHSFRAPFADNSYKIAGGGLIGTPSDLVHLGNALLSGDLIRPETWALLTTPVPLHDGSTEHNYGLGFRTGEATLGDRKVAVLGHSGGSVGGLTAWLLLPAVPTEQGPQDLVVATTINISALGSKANPHPVAYRVVELVLDAIDSGALMTPSRASSDDGQWVSLFNGIDLTGWTPKVRGYPAGENPMDTFRVEDSVISVVYDEYDNFDGRFGHLFYETPYSHYRLRMEYRFHGEHAPGTESWAYRNSGVMLHSPAPNTMPPEQDFPISIEVQFLGGLEDGQDRPTGNLCTPGTHVVIDGVFTEDHCINSSSPTFFGDQWVEAEVLVLGNERVEHYINGQRVLSYSGLVTGGGVVSGYDPDYKPEGEPLGEGYLSLQSEGHPVQFRNIEILDLTPCLSNASSLPEFCDY